MKDTKLGIRHFTKKEKPSLEISIFGYGFKKSGWDGSTLIITLPFGEFHVRKYFTEQGFNKWMERIKKDRDEMRKHKEEN